MFCKNNEKHRPLGDEEEETKSNKSSLPYPKNSMPKVRSFSPDRSKAVIIPDIEEGSGSDPGMEMKRKSSSQDSSADHNVSFEDDVPSEGGATRRYRRLLLLSNLLFVVGSALYMALAVDDLKWAKEAQSIPTYVLEADDDATWVDYRTQQAQAEVVDPQDQPAWTSRSANNSNRKLATYGDYAWEELPWEAQEAAGQLGYDQDSWDNEAEVYTNELYWSELSYDQKVAAGVLGYTQVLWDGFDETTAALAAQEEPDQALEELPIPELPYAALDWDRLQENEKAHYAAQVLGYNRNRWNNDLPPRLVTQQGAMPGWNDLTQAQREAAELLGYAEETWWYIRRYDNWDDLEPEPEPEPVPEPQPLLSEQPPQPQQSQPGQPRPTPPQLPEQAQHPLQQQQAPQQGQGNPNNDNQEPEPEPQVELLGQVELAIESTKETTKAPLVEWELYDWAGLPQDVQQAYVALGWNKNMWNNGQTAYTDYLDWEDLTREEQAAALYLGYNQAMWDGEEEAPVTTTQTPIWEDFDWEELPMEVRLAYQVLGYRQELWEDEGSSETEEKSWEELTITERAAATSLGYTQLMWDGPTTEATPPATPGSGGPVVPTPTELPDAEWFEYEWNDLPVVTQAAYQELGYDQQKWDNSELAYTEELSWEELTPAQQEAATSLGYNQIIWDGADEMTIVAIEEEPYVSEDDDYVFLVASQNVWVSRYMILYFSAALSFVLVGLVDWCRERKIFHACMVLAGLFGMCSAMLIEKDRTVSMILNLISVHFYLLEGLNIIRERIQSRRRRQNNNDLDDESSSPDTSLGSNLWWIPTVQIVADVFFVSGALMDVILSYLYFERSSDWNLSLARVFGFSMLLWFACSILYLLVTLVVHFGLFAGKQQQPVEEQQEPPNPHTKDLNFVGPLPTMSVNSNLED